MLKIPLVVLVGGLGTRMRKFYPDVPKFLIPVTKNKLFADFWFESLDYESISHIYFLIGYEGNQITYYLKKKKINIGYSVISDGDSLLGTGGALKNACNNINSSFFLTYGDTILDVNWRKMLDVFTRDLPPLLLSVILNEGLTDKSNIEINSNNKLIYNKNFPNKNMKYIDYGLSIINKKDFLRSTSKIDSFDLSSWYNYVSLIYNKLPFVFGNKRYYEIGTPKALKEFKNNLKKNVYK
tara:strand:+ start:540 stop:1256 length:717 start_codon:yes stop_codon:yes gene_type:complete